MTSITCAALRHGKLVVLAWIVVAVAGLLTLSSTTGNLTHSLATPGTPGYDANHAIQNRFGIVGDEQPTIAVLRLPAGQTWAARRDGPRPQRTFAAASRAGHLALADYANTHNPKLISADGRTTWALIDMPNPDIPIGSGVIDRIPGVLRAPREKRKRQASTGAASP